MIPTKGQGAIRHAMRPQTRSGVVASFLPYKLATSASSPSKTAATTALAPDPNSG